MKVNHLILTFAAAATLAACSSEMDIPTVADDTQTVTFTAQLPGGMGRSYGDGTTAKNLTYAVYDADGTLMSDLKGTATFDGLKAKVTLTLINGKEYNIVFWASADDSPYTFDVDNATITADYSNTLCNDENLDAFTKTYNVTPGDTDTDVSVTLKRPFAQLNIGTNDLADAKSAGLSDDATISVTVEDVCTTLNLLSGETGGAQDVTFGYGALPSGETFPVSGYDYLAMNYLMVGSDSSTHNVSFQVSGISATNEYSAVPLKANYRTNLYGSLLTTRSTFDVDIEIDPTFETPIITYKDKFYDNIDDAITYVVKNSPQGTAEENTIKIWSGEHFLDATSGIRYSNFNMTFEGMGNNNSLEIGTNQNWHYKNVRFKNLNIISNSTHFTENYTGKLYYSTVEFDNCTIEGTLCLETWWTGSDSIYLKNCEFKNASYSYSAYFIGLGYIDVQNCNFDNILSFLGCGCTNALIEHCNFTTDIGYSYAVYYYQPSMSNTDGKSDTLIINDTKIVGYVNLWKKGYTSYPYTVIVDGVEQ